MTKSKAEVQEHIQYHKDGSIWARGQLRSNTPVGYWEWFRREGTIMRSGYFEDGEPTGEWITYDRDGEVYKVTDRTRK